MNVLHINTSVNGGAGIAALRLHSALLKKNKIYSNFLALHTSNCQYKNVSAYNGRTNQFLKKPEIPTLTLKNYFSEKIFGTYSRAFSEYEKSRKEQVDFEEKIKSAQGKNFELFSSPFSPYNILETAEYKKADIIHLHWICGFVDYPSFFEQNTKPIIWTLHDENPFRGAFHYEADEIRNKTEFGTIDDRFKEIKRNAIAHQKSITIISPSDWLLEKAKKSDTFKNRAAHTIRNTLNTDIFKSYNQKNCRDILGLPHNKTIFCFTAQDVNNIRKGFDLLIPILNENSFEDCVFLIVGQNSNLVNSKNIVSLGSIVDERLMALIYNASDFFILPSREDNLPNTMIESLCCGTPVISFPISDNEQILDNNRGIICHTISTESLFKGIDYAIKNRNSFDRENIAEYAHLNFEENNQSEKYINIYKNI